MNSKETQDTVIKWYSREDIWKQNSSNKTPDSIDRTFIDVDAYIKNKIVLNLGCFYPNEELSFSCHSKEWYAIDIVPEVIERASKLVPLKNVHFEVMDMRNLNYPSNTFNTVLDFSSGDHLLWEDYRKTIKEVKRVLKPNGIFIVLYSNIAFYKEKIENCYGLHGYERRTNPLDMYALLKENNFFILKTQSTNVRSGIIGRLNEN